MIRNLFGKVTNKLQGWNTSVSNKVQATKQNIGNQISSAWQKSTVGQNFAGAAAAFGTPKAKAQAPLEIYQVKSTPQGEVAYGQNNNNIISYGPNTTGGVSSPGVTYYNAQGGQNTSYNTFESGGLRPSTFVDTSKKSTPWTPPVDQYGRESTKSSGVPYVDASGKLVIPTTGFEGLSGFGGGGMANTTPMMLGGQQGLAGTDYARGFASAGQGTTSGLYNQQTSDEESRKKQSTGNTQILNTAGNDPTGQALAALQAQGQQAPIQAPPVEDVIDAGWVSSVRDTLSKTLNSNLSEQDKQAVYAQLQTNLVAAKQKLDQTMALPENPVIDTPEQFDFIEQSEDPFGVRQAIDAFKAEQTNLGQLQTQRVELMKNIQALNEAYKPIVDEIKQNPNLPKALARRKIEGLAFTQKETMQGFLDQLQIVQMQISDQNEVVNRAFQIVNLSENRANRATDNMRANLQLMISSGAIAGFSDADINSYASALGVSTAALQKVRNEALEPKTEQKIMDDDYGNTWSILFDSKGKEISRTKLFAGAPKSSSANSVPQYQQTNNAFAAINSLMQTKDSGGMPYTDANGFFTAQGFKNIVTAAREDGVAREEIVKQYADRFSPHGINSGSYGLSPAEKKVLGY